MADVRDAPTTAEYRVRPFRPADRDGFLDLYETVWGHEKGSGWFGWRFEDVPWGAVRMAVVESRGAGRSGTGIVGAEPLLPFRLRVGDRVVDAYQPVDWIVHPDHRRRGLFTRMTEFVLDDLALDASLCFNFPNDQLLSGLESFDWRVVGRAGTRYRIQNTAALAARGNWETGHAATSALLRIGTPLLRRGLDVVDGLSTPPPDVTVQRVQGVPSETVGGLYAEAVPDCVHVPRTRQYLDWRFANPRWEVTTYVARRGDEPVATVVVATESLGDTRLTQLLDVQPMTDRRRRVGAIRGLLDAVVRDAADADLLKASATTCSTLLRRRGFWRDDAVPLSYVASRTTQAVLALEADALTVGEYDLTDPDSWQLELADRDIG